VNPAILGGRNDATDRIDLGQAGQSTLLQLIGEVLNEVTAPKRVCAGCQAGLMKEDVLRPQRHPGSVTRWEGSGLRHSR